MFPGIENNSLALTNFQGGCEILIRKFQNFLGGRGLRFFQEGLRIFHQGLGFFGKGVEI